MPPTSLSSRGSRAAETPLRIDYAAHMEAADNAYDATGNPAGAIALNVAENRLCWPRLRARIEAITATEAIPDWVPGYASTRGAPEFREALARFLSTHLARCPIAPDSLGVSAGASSVIEMTAFLLADAGDVAAIPAPCYPVYRQDIGALAAVARHDVVTHHEIAEIVDGPVLDVGHLEKARADVEAAGKRLRMVILTTPDNPTGLVYGQGLLARLADWCEAGRVHLVVNEIYGLSLLDTQHPAICGDYPDPAEPAFSSFAGIMAERRSDYLHLWYALSKDLGISGLRVGLVHTHNAAFLQAYANVNLTHTVSNHTQWVLERLLSDTRFMTAYLSESRARLTDAYALMADRLRKLGVPYVPSRGSLFVWIDLSAFLRGTDDDAELALWEEIYRDTGVLLTPGVGFGHTKRGLFRVVYPCVSMEELDVAMDRLERWIGAKRGA